MYHYANEMAALANQDRKLVMSYDDYGIGEAARIGLEMGRQMQHNREIREWEEHADRLVAKIDCLVFENQRLDKEADRLLSLHNSLVKEFNEQLSVTVSAERRVAELEAQVASLQNRNAALAAWGGSNFELFEERTKDYNDLVGKHNARLAERDSAIAERDAALRKVEELTDVTVTLSADIKFEREEGQLTKRLLKRNENTVHSYQGYVATYDALHRALVQELLEHVDPSRLKTLDVQWRASEFLRLSALHYAGNFQSHMPVLALRAVDERGHRHYLPLDPIDESAPFVVSYKLTTFDHNDEVVQTLQEIGWHEGYDSTADIAALGH